MNSKTQQTRENGSKTGYAAQQAIKAKHLKDIFLTALYADSTTRAQLAKTLRLSAPAVSALVEEALVQGLLVETAKWEPGVTGRPPVFLEINPDARQLPVLSFQRSGIEYVLYNLRLQELESFLIPYGDEITGRIEETDQDVTKYRTISSSTICRLVKEQLLPRAKRLDRTKTPVLILSLPGVFDRKANLFCSSHLHFNVEGSFLQELSDAWDQLPVFPGNDSDFYAYAEKSSLPVTPEISRRNDLIFVNIQYGVGAGIIYQNQLFTCQDADVGEIGHITIDCNGPKCMCGSRGCLERYLSFDALLQAVRGKLKKGIPSLLSSDRDQLTMARLCQAYDAKDPLVTEVLEEAAQKLVFGLGNVLAIFQVPQIILGGGIEILGDRFLDCVRKQATLLSYRKVWDSVQINYGKKIPHGNCFGGARYYLDSSFMT